MRAFLQRLSAPPKQTLQTLQPTPSTVSYKVTTRPAQSLASTFTRYISLQFRLTVGICTALLVWSKWCITFQKPTSVLEQFLGKTWEASLILYAGQCEWMYLAPCAIVVLFLVFRRGYTEESLTVLRGLGVQTSTTSSTYLQTPTTRFIPTTSIQDIVIHEAFKGFEVRFYLAIIVEGEEDVVVVFSKLLPRRAMLEEVWRGSRRCLWDTKRTRNADTARTENVPWIHEIIR